MLSEFVSVAEGRVLLSEKSVDGFAAELVEVMYLVDLDYFNLVPFAVKIVDLFDRGVLLLGDIVRPVASCRDKQHWLWRKHGGDLNIAGVEPQVPGRFRIGRRLA